jgi:hypothetical protein
MQEKIVISNSIMGLLETILSLFGRHGKKPESEEEAKLRWQQKQEEMGAFEYDAEGFSYPFESGTSLVRWAEVDRIVGYRLDLFTIDEMCLELHVKDRAIRFSESTPGWYRFLGELRTVFPVIRENWDWEVTIPPFATNYTVLYERKDGGLFG